MAENLQKRIEQSSCSINRHRRRYRNGLFLGAGQTIAMTGPSILLTYIIIGFMLFMFMRGLGEIIIQNTNFKSFADVTNKYIGPFAGFCYWLDLLVMLDYYRYG